MSAPFVYADDENDLREEVALFLKRLLEPAGHR